MRLGFFNTELEVFRIGLVYACILAAGIHATWASRWSLHAKLLEEQVAEIATQSRYMRLMLAQVTKRSMHSCLTRPTT